MPSKEELPEGPHRDLVGALHKLYRQAGKPSFRTISREIKDDDRLPGTFSPDTVSKVLSGAVVPSWPRVQALVRYFCAASIPRPIDADEPITLIHPAWLAATEASVPRRTRLADPVPAALVELNGWAHPNSELSEEAQFLQLHKLELDLLRAHRADDRELQAAIEHGLVKFLAKTSPEEGQESGSAVHSELVELAARMLSRFPRQESWELNGLRLPNLPWNGIDLRTCQLENSRLRNGRLSRANLSGANLKCASLSDTDLTHAVLMKTRLDEAELQGTNFFMACLRGASLRSAVLDGANFDEANLNDSRWDQATGMTVRFGGASLRRASFNGTKLIGADFSQANMRGTDFQHSKLTQCDFRRTDLRGANFLQAELSGCLFGDTDLEDRTLDGAYWLTGRGERWEIGVNVSAKDLLAGKGLL